MVMLRKSVLSLVVLVLVAGFVFAATLEGTIRKVDSGKSTLLITDKNKKEVTITVNKDAKVMLDGKAAKLSDLKEGQTAKVTHEDNKASAVEAKSADKK
jgi:biopolymer transport protein ExbD